MLKRQLSVKEIKEKLDLIKKKIAPFQKKTKKVLKRIDWVLRFVDEDVTEELHQEIYYETEAELARQEKLEAYDTYAYVTR